MHKKIVLLATLVALAGGCKSTEPMKTEPVNQNMVMTAPDKIYFGFDRSDLTSSSMSSLDEQVEWLKENEDVKILIEGHCDEIGTREYNMDLGQRRADATKNYLVSMGIASRRIKTVSFGEDRPDYLGHSESVWKKNRRAVIVVRE